MMFEIQTTTIPGLLVLTSSIFHDTRGSFKKVLTKKSDDLSL